MPLLLLLISPALALCDKPSDASAISAGASAAQLAMASLDTDTFAKSVADARASLACLASPINPLDAASYHALMGLDAFMGGDANAATVSFQAAMSSTPDFRLPAIIAPVGGPLDAALAKARGLTSLGSLALPPFDGIILVDGVSSVTYPRDRPWILQLVSRKGEVTETRYLIPGDELPRWAPPPTAFQRVLPKVRKQPSVPFGIAAGTTAAAAVTLYALGGTWHADYLDPATPYEDLGALRAQSDGALAASIALGVVTVGLGTFTVITW